MINSSTNLKTSDLKQLKIAHKLAHSIRNEDTDEFLNIYDKIPSSLSAQQLANIKETARSLSELSQDDFKTDCIKLNCNYSSLLSDNNQQKMTDLSTTNNSKSLTKDGDIVRNEAFFNDKSNQTNPVYNPLLLTSSNKFHNVMQSSSSNNNSSKITIANTQLYKDNFTETSSSLSKSNESIDSNLNTTNTSNSTQQKCRFVTNQLYQNKKDSQHNKCVLTNCFDEVVAANQTDNESDSENSYYDDDDDEEEKKESISSTSSSSSTTNSSVASNSPATEQQSVIIDMEEDDDDDDDDKNNVDLKDYNVNKNKEKFENLVQSKEKANTKLTKMDINDADMNEIIASEPINLTENKYEKDDELLKTYKDECKYGYINPQHRERAKQILNKRTIEINKQVTMTTQNETFKSSINDNTNNVNNKRYSATSLHQSNSALKSSMRNDFNKNEDEDDDYDETNQLKCHDNTNNKNIKTLINKKPPPPPTTSSSSLLSASATSTTTTSLYATNKPDDSDIILSSLVNILHEKNKHVTPAKSFYSPTSLQFNNYKTDIDLNSNFGLNYDSTGSDHVKTSSLLNTSDVVLNFDDLKKSSISSSSSSSSSSTSSSSSSGVVNRLASSINRRSAEAYMDSHGSSLTNSSKQEEDDDFDDETNITNTNNANLSDCETNEFSLLNKTCIFKNTTSNNNYGSIKNDNNNQLKQTIESLSQAHVDKAKLEVAAAASTISKKSSYLTCNSGNKPLTSTTTTTTNTIISNNSSSLASSKLTSNKSNNSGVFHQKYPNYQYDPTDVVTAPSKAITQTLQHLDSSLKTSTNTTTNESSRLSSQQQQQQNTNKFSSLLNSKSNKRNNKKKLKASLELNNPDGDGSNNKYSEHYSEDIDQLLQFITSSDTNTTPTTTKNTNNSNKTVKQFQQQSQSKQQKQPQQQPIKSEKINTNNNKSNKKPESTKQIKTNEIITHNNTQEKEPETSNSQLEVVEEEDKKPVNTVKETIKTTDELDILNEISFITANNSNFNTSGEFVTVKGRKLRKTNKKDTTHHTSTSVITSSSQATSSSTQSKPSINNTSNTTSIKLKTNNTINKKSDTISKPSSNESKTNKQQQSQPPITLTTIKQAVTNNTNTYNIRSKESLPIRVSSSAPVFTTLVTPSSQETKPMDTPVNDFVNDLNNAIFPPLLPSKPFSSIVSESIKPPTTISQEQTVYKEQDKKVPVETNEEQIVDKIVEFKLDSPKIELSQNEINQQQPPPPTPQTTITTNQSTKPQKKIKFEFLTQRNTSSVIFLDEINQTNNSNTNSILLNSDNQTLSTVNKKNILNGIKFGFIDSSTTSEDEEQPQIDKTNVETETKQDETSDFKEDIKKDDFVNKKPQLNSRVKKKLNTKLKQPKSNNSSTSTTSTDYDSDTLNQSNFNQTNNLNNQRKLKKKNKKIPKLKSLNINSSTMNNMMSKQKSSDESLSNNEKLINNNNNNKMKPVNLNSDNSNYASSTTTTTTTSTTSITLPTLSLLNNIQQSHPNYAHHQIGPTGAAQPLIFYQNQMNAYLAAYYAGAYHQQGLIPPTGAAPPPNHHFISGNLMPQFIQHQQQFYPQPNYYYNNNNNQQTNKPVHQEQQQQSQSTSEAKSENNQQENNATNQQQQSSTNSSTNSTPTPQTTNQSEQIVPTNPTLVQINPEYFSANVAHPPLSASYAASSFIATPTAPFGYSYLHPMSIDYMPSTAMIAPANPITSPTGSETLIQLPLQSSQLVHIPPTAVPVTGPTSIQNISTPNFLSPNQTQQTDNFSNNSNNNINKKENDVKNNSKSRYYNNQSYRNNNNQRNYNYNHSHYPNMTNNAANYYFNGHHNMQHQQLYASNQHVTHQPQQTDYYTSNRMPLYATAAYTANPNMTGHPIADALQVAYAADYKGDFNLDETAYYVAKQWNNMKLAETNTNSATVNNNRNNNQSN